MTFRLYRRANLHDFHHPGGLAIEMDRYNRFRLVGNGLFHQYWIDIEVVFQHIDQDRRGPAVDDG